MDKDVSQGTGQAIQPDMELNKEKTHVYVLAGSTVSFTLFHKEFYINFFIAILGLF